MLLDGLAALNPVQRRKVAKELRKVADTRAEMPSPSSDWMARQPHARGWLG